MDYEAVAARFQGLESILTVIACACRDADPALGKNIIAGLTTFERNARARNDHTVLIATLRNFREQFEGVANP